jgi:hypothetical protein
MLSFSWRIAYGPESALDGYRPQIAVANSVAEATMRRISPHSGLDDRRRCGSTCREDLTSPTGGGRHAKRPEQQQGRMDLMWNRS